MNHVKRSICFLLAAAFLLSACVVAVSNASAAVPEPEWEAATPLPYPVYLAATVQDDSYNLYIIGGRVGVGTESYDKVTLYDLETEQVSELATMPVGVNGASAAIGFDGNIYVFGGRNNSLAEIYQYEVQIYDPSTDSWSLGAGMPNPSSVSEAVAMPNGLIYVFSGINETVSSTEPSGLVQIYDPAANSWSFGADMPEPRYSGGTVAITDNVIMYIGGSNPNIGFTYSDIIYYHVEEDQWWGSMNPFPEKFAGGDVMVGPDGMIYLIGGGQGNSAYSTSSMSTDRSFCMDPYHNEFVYMPELTIDRKYHSVGFDEEGNVFAIGGFSLSDPAHYTTSTAEKIKVMDLRIMWFPQERGIMTGEQIMVITDYDFAFAPYEELTTDVVIINSDGEVVATQTSTAYVKDGNPGHFYIDVPQLLPSGDYDVQLTKMRPSDYGYDDLSFEGFSSSLTFTHAGSVVEQLADQNQTIGDLQDTNDALASDLADANDQLDAMASNLMVVMVLAIVAIIVAAIAVVLLLRKKA